MRILFSGVELAGWTDNPAGNITVNGQQLVDIIPIVGATNQRLYPRGNSFITLQFSVKRILADMETAEIFALTHFDNTTKTGTCEVQCGWDGNYTSVYLYNAVIESAITDQQRGIAIDVTYTIKAAKADTASPPQFLIDDSDVMILKGEESLSASDTSKAVTFSSAFSSAPTVTAVVSKPSGGDHFFVTVDESTITTNGFTGHFSGAISGSGYVMHWIAML